MSLSDYFVEACVVGDLCRARALHKQGADIHTWDDIALRRAARYGHLDVVKYIVKHGANIQARDDSALKVQHPDQGHETELDYSDYNTRLESAQSSADSGDDTRIEIADESEILSAQLQTGEDETKV